MSERSQKAREATEVEAACELRAVSSASLPSGLQGLSQDGAQVSAGPGEAVISCRVQVGSAPTERHPETQLLALCTARSSRVITMQCDLLSHMAFQSGLLTSTFKTSHSQLAG